MEERLIDVNEVAEYLKVSKATVYDLVYHNHIPYIKIGRCLRFRKDLIDIWIKNSTHIPFDLKMKNLYTTQLVGSEEAHK